MFTVEYIILVGAGVFSAAMIWIGMRRQFEKGGKCHRCPFKRECKMTCKN